MNMRFVAVAAICLAAPAAAAPARSDILHPERVVGAYFSLLEQHRYAAALRLRGNDVPLAAFVAAFRRYASYRAAVGPAGDDEGAAGSTFAEVQVRVHGRLRDGRAFSERGRVTVRHVNDIEGATAAERRWHIYRIDVPPRFAGN